MLIHRGLAALARSNDFNGLQTNPQHLQQTRSTMISMACTVTCSTCSTSVKRFILANVSLSAPCGGYLC